MKSIKLLLSGSVFLGFLALTGLVAATNVWAADLGVQPQIKADILSKTGDDIRLFHGGTEEAKKLFCKGEVVPVYRYVGRHLQTKEVGKVEIGEFAGDHYVDGKVVEGEVKPGDVAMKKSAACLVVDLNEK